MRIRSRRLMYITGSDAGAPATPAAAIAALDAADTGVNAADPADDGGATSNPAPDGDGNVDVDVDADEGADELGDKGKQALDRMKAKLRAERERRTAAEAKLRESLPQDDAQRIAHEAEVKALARANARILSAEVRAAATGRLSDPSDALTFIDLDQFEVDDDGAVDQDEIADAVADLLTRKPYLAAQGGSKSPKPDPSQGAAGGAPVTAADRFAAQFANKI